MRGMVLIRLPNGAMVSDMPHRTGEVIDRQSE